MGGEKQTPSRIHEWYRITHTYNHVMPLIYRLSNCNTSDKMTVIEIYSRIIITFSRQFVCYINSIKVEINVNMVWCWIFDVRVCVCCRALTASSPLNYWPEVFALQQLSSFSDKTNETSLIILKQRLLVTIIWTSVWLEIRCKCWCYFNWKCSEILASSDLQAI